MRILSPADVKTSCRRRVLHSFYRWTQHEPPLELIPKGARIGSIQDKYWRIKLYRSPKVLSDSSQLHIVIPAEAGIQETLVPGFNQDKVWTPAFAHRR
jgi:hypothetical protein